ncbi:MULTISPECIES: Spy/CpxP family protein refolding chaperone [Chromobacterium]|uniref:Spy/CpxP family protein refolding chaperone n=1 Tax=Chromobacterium aquaticum TaxID=467180 RepID=A0ABV8ZPV9_9NEIS|nr:Spy/CpxP family protein refolding chaperone [Chromobacterium aquaticum]MCD5360484.1 Spy/CpxP family protein refolding chaperone [Chromobacterium aquaticum]
MKPLIPLVLACLLAGAAQAARPEMDCPPMGSFAGRPWKIDPAKRDAFIAQHQKALHDKLKIQPAQEAAWLAFASASRPGAMPPCGDSGDTAPERMEQRVLMAQRHLLNLQKRLEALKSFYAQLNPEQRKIMDKDSPPPMGGRGQGPMRKLQAGQSSEPHN